MVNRRTSFIAGALIASTLFFWVGRRENRADLTPWLGLDDRELVSRKDEIEAMEGQDGKVLKALLACVGFRLKASEPRVSTRPPDAASRPDAAKSPAGSRLSPDGAPMAAA